MISTIDEQNINDFHKKLETLQKDEDILKDNPDRWVILPLSYPSIWDMYKERESHFWTVEDFDFSENSSKITFASLNDNILDYVVNILATNILTENTKYGSGSVFACEMLKQIQAPEARAFYGFQCAFEFIHYELYNHLYTFFNKNNDANIVKNVSANGIFKKKKEWIKKNMRTDQPFCIKLIIMYLTKTLFNTCNRILIEYLKKEKLCTMLCDAYTKIEYDNILEANFCLYIYKYNIDNKIDTDILLLYIKQVILLETEFASHYLPLDIMDISKCDIEAALEFSGSMLLKTLKVNTDFDKKNPQLFFNLDYTNMLVKTENHSNNKKKTDKKVDDSQYGTPVFSMDTDF